eukprot:c33600_g1_i1 orf=3-179(-)
MILTLYFIRRQPARYLQSIFHPSKESAEKNSDLAKNKTSQALTLHARTTKPLQIFPDKY